MSGPQRVLITGGAGFIASAVASRLVPDYQLVLLDLDFDDGRPVTYTGLLDNPRVTTVVGDVRDYDLARKAMEGVDAVVHAAAVVGVRNVIDNSRTTIETNILGTVNMVQAAAEQAHLKRFVYFSTSEVFGGSSFRVDEGAFASVGTVDEARWSYAIAKLAGEHLVAAYHREVGFPGVIVRPFNVFGPGRVGDHAMLRFVRAALTGEDLVVHGDGSQIRSWCYIDDFAAALLTMLERPSAVGHDFNIGNSRNTITIYRLAQLVVRLTGSGSRVVFEDIDHPDIDVRVPTTSKASQLLGYDPRVDIEEGIARTVAWYRDHPEALGSG